ncbi:hypothetical protein CHS0354_019347 [Potamilus streckersoni]|uniref:Uncharacterized protein n=1 Tax=Potamilus streckersoni TaxID=2493646 RepID=A0AAE0SI26_9BIVA|nr:hypothetical protein CHS0354_019347 [Potamilus streckersoni]
MWKWMGTVEMDGDWKLMGNVEMDGDCGNGWGLWKLMGNEEMDGDCGNGWGLWKWMGTVEMDPVIIKDGSFVALKAACINQEIMKLVKIEQYIIMLDCKCYVTWIHTACVVWHSDPHSLCCMTLGSTQLVLYDTWIHTACAVQVKSSSM